MTQRERLELPNSADKLLLHSCCAPCSGEVMEALISSEINFTIFFIIRTFTLFKNMKSEKMKILILHKNTIFHLLMRTMTKIIGLLGLRVWSGNLSVVNDAPCVLICVLNAQHYMLTNMVFL